MSFDLSVYLVTDSTKAILGDKDLVQIVESACHGGVTIVQYRDKHSDTAVLIDTGTKIHKITQSHGVPLLINDRIDVALAIGAEGVHLGQDDTPIQAARKILGDKAIIGISANTVEEAKIAIDAGADYLGIGAMFGTPTKTDTKSLLGPTGTKDFLSAISYSSIPCVAIGGINTTNAARVLYQSASPDKSLSGIAVVSAIVAAENPWQAAFRLKDIVSSQPTHLLLPPTTIPSTASTFSLSNTLSQIPALVSHHRNLTPLSHNMTNTVVQNFAANVCLSISASPIMSLSGPEALDLAALRGGLVINMGTLTPEHIRNYLQATTAYNSSGNPIVFDPVGAGATSLRRSAVKTLMSGSYFSVIKGNESEISTVYNTSFNLSPSSSVAQKGVDSGPSTSSEHDKAKLVKSLALRETNVVLMTGATDYLSDGHTVLAVKNGHPYLGKITGSGCALGAVIAAYLASARNMAEPSITSGKEAEACPPTYLQATLAALLLYEIAAQTAVMGNTSGAIEVRGPGTFIPAFVDALHYLTFEDEDCDWIKEADVQVIDVEV